MEPEIDVRDLEPAGAYADHEAPLAAELTSIDDDLDGLFDNDDFDAAISSSVEANMNTALGEPEIATATRGDLDVSMARSGHDPYAVLSALSAGLKSSQGRSDVAASVVHASGAAQHAVYQREQMPEIETVDVPEPAIALADDLDLPEVAFEPEPAAKNGYDDIDSELPIYWTRWLRRAPLPLLISGPQQPLCTARTHASASCTSCRGPVQAVRAGHDAPYPVYSDQCQLPLDTGAAAGGQVAEPR